MKFQTNIFVKLAGSYLTPQVSFDLDEVIGNLLILCDKRDKERKYITLLTEMVFVGTDFG